MLASSSARTTRGMSAAPCSTSTRTVLPSTGGSSGPIRPQISSASAIDPSSIWRAETERDISNFFWKGSDVVLYQKDFGGDENFHVLAVNARSGQATDLTPWDGVRASIEDDRSEEHTSELQSHSDLVCRLLLEKKKKVV